MSSYERRKVLRLPVDSLVSGKDTDIWGIFGEIEDNHPELCFSVIKKPFNKGFEVAFTDKREYLDWVFDYEYDTSPVEMHTARELTETERLVATDIFKKANIDFNPTDIHLVEYSWYNCSEPEDAYDVEPVHDESGNFL